MFLWSFLHSQILKLNSHIQRGFSSGEILHLLLPAQVSRARGLPVPRSIIRRGVSGFRRQGKSGQARPRRSSTRLLPKIGIAWCWPLFVPAGERKWSSSGSYTSRRRLRVGVPGLEVGCANSGEQRRRWLWRSGWRPPPGGSEGQCRRHNPTQPARRLRR